MLAVIFLSLPPPPPLNCEFLQSRDCFSPFSWHSQQWLAHSRCFINAYQLIVPDWEKWNYSRADGKMAQEDWLAEM